MSNNRPPRTRVTRPDLAAQPAPPETTEAVDTSGYAEMLDLPGDPEPDAVQPGAPSAQTLDLPARAEGNTVRDANGRFLAVCGGTHQTVEQRIGLARLFADAINAYTGA